MKKPLLFASLLFVIAFGCIDAVAQEKKQPNIVILMVDDLGWNHISAAQATMGTHDKAYYTPNLEKLAKGGLSFTHAYAQPNCAPTRAAMLSGQYPARVNNNVYVVGNLNRNGRGGISKADAHFVGPQQSNDVSADAITIAEALQKNGYATAHIGKYHVGGHSGQQTMPENVGFDISLGGFSQGHQPVCFATKSASGWKFRGLGLGHFDRFADPYSEEYVAQHGLPKELVGTPKHVSDALGDAMEETIGKLHATGKPFYLQFHTYAVHGPVQARPDLKQAAIKRNPKSSGKSPEYLGFISSVDENIGRLLETLKDPNRDGDTSDSIADNTLVLFTSDNGGTHADNLPLKGVKGMLTEGGIRVPLIAYWPGVIHADTVSHHMIHAVDYYPTCLELAGGKWSPPAAKHPLDGESFADLLRQPQIKRMRKPVFYLFPGYMDKRAQPTVVVIDNIDGKRYKLLYYYEGDRWELYCLSDDQGEATNLIDKEQAIAATLSKQMHAWLTQEHATWQPKYPIDKATNKPAGPPPVLAAAEAQQ